jgi:GTP-binding protein EngB required for normal cell division
MVAHTPLAELNMKKTIQCLASNEIEGYHLEHSQHLNLSRLNIFIGANNSGKSRLLRLLFSKNDAELARDIPFSAESSAPNFFPILRLDRILN